MKAKLHLTVAAFVMAASNASAASVIQFSQGTYTVVESAGRVALTVQRRDDVNTLVSVDYATADGTATNGVQYTAVSGTLTFGPAETNQTVEVPVLNNGLASGTKIFRVLLSNPSNAVLATPSSASVSIMDNDIGIQFQQPSYPHPNSPKIWEDIGVVRVGVFRDDGDQAVAVDVATSNLTAIDGVDYTGVVTNLVFAPAEWVKYVCVPILNNSVKDANKTFRLILSNPSGATLGSVKMASVTISDNDTGFTFQSSAYSVTEDAGAVLIGVLRGTDENSAATVDMILTDVTATNGLDYTGATRTLSFAPGEKLQQVAIPILNDGVKESTETFRVVLSNPGLGAELSLEKNATVTIWDNDPRVGFDAATQSVWARAGAVPLAVLRGNDGALGPFAVDYATSNETAEAGKDYQAISGTMHFQENDTVKGLTIPILSNAARQGPMSFRVSLSNPTGGMTLGTATIVVTIIKNDYAVKPPFADQLTIRREQGVNILNWIGGGKLQQADQVTGPWHTLAAGKNPYNVDSPLPGGFYRIQPPRPATLYVPSSYDGHTPMPLVIMLHGGGVDSQWIEDYMHFRPWAETRRFLCCYPEACRSRFMQGLIGNGKFWIDADEVNNIMAQMGDPHVDDIAYLRSLIQQIGREFALDTKRVYLVGHSNGGSMAYAMACASSDLIAGIASLNGPCYADAYTHCVPSQPVNILSIYGTSDMSGASNFSIMYWGGIAVLPGLPLRAPHAGAMRVSQMWAAHDGAQNAVTDPGATLDLTTDVAGLDTVVTRYTEHPPGGAVELWTINGGAHAPTLSRTFSSSVIDWLLAHPKP